jgi:hypothetical protein
MLRQATKPEHANRSLGKWLELGMRAPTIALPTVRALVAGAVTCNRAKSLEATGGAGDEGR